LFTKRLANVLFRIPFFFIRPRFRLSLPIPKFILTVWRRDMMNPMWFNHIDGFDIVSVKIVDRASPYDEKEAKEVVVGAAAKGLGVHGWGFHYCTSIEDAQDEAEAAARACIKLGVTGYHWNAEKQWVESEDPEAYGIHFAQTFKAIVPEITLYANCFSSMMSKPLLKSFDRMEPMLYGTRRSTIAKKFKGRLAGKRGVPRWKKSAMVGTGRMEKGSLTRAWGYLESTDAAEGLLDLVLRYRPTSVNCFRAGRADGEDIMLKPNKLNPVLNEQVARIKRALVSREKA